VLLASTASTVLIWRASAGAPSELEMTGVLSGQSTGSAQCTRPGTGGAGFTSIALVMTTTRPLQTGTPKSHQLKTSTDVSELKQQKELARAEAHEHFVVEIFLQPFKGPGQYPIRPRGVIGYAKIRALSLPAPNSPATQLWTSVPVLGDGVTVALETQGGESWHSTANSGQVTVAQTSSGSISGSLEARLSRASSLGIAAGDGDIHLSGRWRCGVLESN
jgi:hypothetical protein